MSLPFWPFRRRNKKARIDPFTLTDPWRSFVQDAQQATTRFERIVASVDDGPIFDRLADIDDKVHAGLASCWQIAQTGHSLNKMLREVADSDSDAVTRMRERRDDTANKLAALTKQLDDAVARAAELATNQHATFDDVSENVDGIVLELEALRQAIAEIRPT